MNPDDVLDEDSAAGVRRILEGGPDAPRPTAPPRPIPDRAGDLDRAARAYAEGVVGTACEWEDERADLEAAFRAGAAWACDQADVCPHCFEGLPFHKLDCPDPPT